MKILFFSLAFIISTHLQGQSPVLSVMDMADSSKAYITKGNYDKAAFWAKKGIEENLLIDFSQYKITSEQYKSYLYLHTTLATIYGSFQQKYAAAYPIYEKIWSLNKRANNELDMSSRLAIDGMIMTAKQAKLPKKEVHAYKKAIELCDYKITHYTKSNLPAYLQMTYNEKDYYSRMGLSVCQLHQIHEEYLFFANSLQTTLQQTNKTNTSEYLESIAAHISHYIQSGNYTKARIYIVEGEQLLKKNPSLVNTNGNMFFSKNTALYYRNTGDFNTAAEKYLTLIDVSRRLYGENNQNLGTFYNELAQLYTEMRYFKTADEFYEKSLRAYAKTQGVNSNNYEATQVMQINNNIAQLWNQSNQDPPTEFKETYLNKLELDCKRMLATKARRFGTNHVEYANTLVLLSSFYTVTHDYINALDCTEKALNIREQFMSKNSQSYRKLLFEYAQLAELTGDIDLSAQSFRAFNTLTLQHLKLSYAGMNEQQRNQLLKTIIYDFYVFNNFIHRNVDAYPELAEDLLNNNILLKGLSLETSISIKSKIQQSGDTSLLDLYNQWLELRNQLIAYQDWTPSQLQNKGINLDAIQTAIEQKSTQLALSSATLQQSLNSTMTYNYTTMKQQLKTGEATIEFVHAPYRTDEYQPFEDFYYALITKPNEPLPILVKLGYANQFVQLLKPEVTASSSNYISDKVEGEYLYELLWQPIDYYLEGVQKIYLSPSGILHKVAFNALLSDYSSEKRLLEDYDLHYLSSMRDFFSLKHFSTRPTDSLTQITLVGGVDFGTDEVKPQAVDSSAQKRAHAGSFTYLYGTKLEVNNIAQALEKKNKRSIVTQKLLAKDAQEAAIKHLTGNQAPHILHIASHGFFFEKDFEWNNCQQCKLSKIGRQSALFRSGIALADANAGWAVDYSDESSKLSQKEDGILTAYEVSNMNLSNTELVILSACETGRGDISNTEGVMGLQRAFKIAGCDKMILSLWKVPDKQTSELMTYFYQFYANGIDIPTAFRKAQLKMAKLYDNPYYWAAFVLTE